MLPNVPPRAAPSSGVRAASPILSGCTTAFARFACTAIVHWMPHAAVLLDDDLRVVLANRVAGALFRSTPENLRRVPIVTLVSQTTLPALLRNVGARPVTIETAGSETALTLKINAVRLALR